jgi:methylthioribulose-1-phosphate dehydratase
MDSDGGSPGSSTRQPGEPTSAVQGLIDAGRWLDARGYAPATSGNYSMRLGPGRILVTASGKHKGRLGPDDFVIVDEDGHPVDGSGDSASPSAETPLHVLMFRLDPRIGAVLHTHSVCATVLSMLLEGASTLELTAYEMLKAFPGISSHTARVSLPIFENGQDIPLLAREVEARWRQEPFPGYILRGHGAYAWGETLPLALRSAEALEFLVACELERKRRVPR